MKKLYYIKTYLPEDIKIERGSDSNEYLSIQIKYDNRKLDNSLLDAHLKIVEEISTTSTGGLI